MNRARAFTLFGVDAIHFTQSGDRQMAQAIFQGITNVLAADLAPVPAGYASSATR